MVRPLLSALSGLERVHSLSQARLAVCCVLLVQHTLAHCLVDLARGNLQGCLCFVSVASFDGCADVADVTANFAAHSAVAQASLFVGLVPLDLRLDICHFNTLLSNSIGREGFPIIDAPSAGKALSA